jgi:hypothetical protein
MNRQFIRLSIYTTEYWQQKHPNLKSFTVQLHVASPPTPPAHPPAPHPLPLLRDSIIKLNFHASSHAAFHLQLVPPVFGTGTL